MLNSACEMPFFLDKSWQVWAANRRPPKADQRAISTSSRPARVRRPPARGAEARQMSLRTPAIRRDRPTVRGSPALRARSTSAGRVPAELSAKNHPCDAKDHARPRKCLEQNSFLKRGVQVQYEADPNELERSEGSWGCRRAASGFGQSGKWLGSLGFVSKAWVSLSRPLRLE